MATQETSSTAYIILAENQRKKKALQETKVKCEQLLGENRLLLEEREANQQETYEVTEFLRKEILRKNEKIGSLEQILEQREILVEQEKTSFIKHAETKVNELKQQWGSRENDLVTQVEFLQKELTALKDFKERQLEIEAEMERLRQVNEELKHQQEVKTAELERKFIEQNTKMKKEYEQKLEELKKACEEDINERLDASVKRILQQNRRMAEELRLHVQETDELQREKKVLEEECTTLLREVQLKQEMESQYAKRGSKQTRSIKEAGSKVESLEKSMGLMMADFKNEMSALKEKNKVEMETAKLEVDGLRRLLKLKTRELNNIRRLAQEVVRQRSDVETFLIDSLSFVREQIYDEQARGERESFRGDELPPLSGSSGHGNGQRAFITSGTGGAVGTADTARSSREKRLMAGKLDIRDLPWDDREKVLRLLFSKINNASAHSYFGNLPPNSFDNEPLDHDEDFPPPPRRAVRQRQLLANGGTPWQPRQNPDGHRDSERRRSGESGLDCVLR